MSPIIHMHDYDSTHLPAMPVLEVGLSILTDVTPATSLIAQVDSGADSTIIPVRVLKDLKAEYIGEVYMIGVTGDRQRVRLYSVAVYLGNHRVVGIDAVANLINKDCLIGRDVLNQLEVTLNRLAGVTEVRS